MTSGGRIRTTLSKVPAFSMMTPSPWQRASTLEAAAGSGVFRARSETSSTAAIAPITRTSPTAVTSSTSGRRRCSKISPIRWARAMSPPRSTSAMEARAAAQQIGLPPKVVPRPPGGPCPRGRPGPSCRRSATPPPRPFAVVMMSGHDARMLRGEPAARTGEAGLHLVGDEDDPVGSAVLGRAPARNPPRG